MNTALPHTEQPESGSAPTLAALLDILPDAAVTGPTGVAVADVRFDSRQVQPGDLFVAISHPGYQHDGHNFVPGALDRGAVGVVVGRPVAVPADVAQVVVRDPPRALALLSAARAGWPAARLGIVGVTGTDGKTTTTTLIAGALQELGHTAAHVSTASLGTGAAVLPNKSRQSTPEAPEIQHLLAQATDHGADYAVIEATSHGLAQDRLYGTEVDVAVYTNITHEHLDYHGSIEEYVAAKARLLALQAPLPGVPAKPHPHAKAAVLNADDAHCAHLRSLAQVPVTTYGLHRPADVHAVSTTYDGLRPSVQVRTPWGNAQLRPRVVGPFNVANVLAALTTLGVLGCPLEATVPALCRQAGAPGRMELIEAGQPFAVIVDYAHTPASPRTRAACASALDARPADRRLRERRRARPGQAPHDGPDRCHPRRLLRPHGRGPARGRPRSNPGRDCRRRHGHRRSSRHALPLLPGPPDGHPPRLRAGSSR